ncbi:MAG TPA: hypothetical protein VG755_40925 [Nannocystaceae bacterium]|nr:hypothetical protein [Nannocystaceae bacterium]
MRFEQQLEAVRAALDDRNAAANALLKKTVAGNNGYLVGTIADALEEGDALLAGLPAAFARLLDDAVKRDPACRGKVAIAKALDRAELREEAVFLAGVRHVQREPVWGGTVDTAGELRGVCGMGLVHMRHDRAMVEVALLLADPEVAARTAAARAIAASGDRTVGEPLLRLRIAVGEPEPEVLGELFAALLDLCGSAALDDVAKFFRHEERALAEAAAIAIGSSRLPGAFVTLRDAEDAFIGASRRVRLLAIALVRDSEAWEFLLACVKDGSKGEAEDAARALATFRHDDELVTKLRAAAGARTDLARTLDELLTQ